MAEEKATFLDYIARGILTGGALGVFAYLVHFTGSLFWSVGGGMIAGCFAGITIGKIIGRKAKS